MIDDTVLERIIGDAGDAVSVPADGPARVLAALEQMSGPDATGRSRHAVAAVGRRRPRPRVLVAAAAVLVAVVATVGLVGAGGHGDSSSSSVNSAGLSPEASPSFHQATGSGGMLAHGNAASGTAAAGPSGSAAGLKALTPTGSSAPRQAAGVPAVGAPPVATGGAAPPNEVPSLPTKVVQTGSVSLTVAKGRVPTTMTTLTADATGLGGYLASSASTDSVPGSPATGSLVLRVPVASFATLVADARRAGTATAVTTAGQDVTAQYVDLQARIDALTAARTQYEQILAKAETIGDILSVESELSDVQTQIEQLQGQIDVLGDQAAYSTLTLHVAEVTPTPPPPPVHHATQSGLSKAWGHARSTFASGVESVVAALGGIAVFLVTVGVLGLIARVAWVLGRRRMV